MKIGDLVKWIDYTQKDASGTYIVNGVPKLGYVLKEPKNMKVRVLYNGEEHEWAAWQCEVVSESR